MFPFFITAGLIRKLIRIVEESNIYELEVTGWGQKIKITKKLQTFNQVAASPLIVQPVKQEPPKEVKLKKEETESNLIPIKSSMVGIFFRAPAPGAKPFVEVGEVIKPGQVVCIIEAMKLMNEIESDVPGKVVKILVENEQPVEFGQSLFLIEQI